MEGLDFSQLSDDQMLGLIRAALREVVARGPAMEAAARDAVLDEAERDEIRRRSAEREAAILRARERERVAAEAAEAVRAAHAAQESEALRHANSKKAAAAARSARRQANRADAAARQWLNRAAALVDQPAGAISLLLVDTAYGRRVLINKGPNRYERKHLADWCIASGAISTSRDLLRRKADLAAFAAEFASYHPAGMMTLIGETYFPETAP